jgi:alginate biosynthesis protein Alg44
MSVAFKTNLVHESETQRQYVRVKIPACIQFMVDGAERSYGLNDISAGGFSFYSPDEEYIPGQDFSGRLHISVNAVGFSIAVNFAIYVHADESRVACLFQDLGPQEIAALRHVITAYLGGELVTTGDMLTTLSRENFVRPRTRKGGNGLSIGGRVRAVLGTGLALIIGIAAFSYTAMRLYDIVIVTHAAAAKIAAQTYTITMPRDGTFFSLLPPDGRIKKGQPLGSFQTALLDVVAGVPGTLKLSPEELSQIIGQQLQGSLASPCDCIVHKQFVTDAQYVLRNQSIVELVPQNARPYVLARFHYDDVKKLRRGRKVRFALNGSPESLEGTISELRVLPAQTIDSNGLNDLNGLNTNAAITDVIAVIESGVALQPSRIDEPVDVRMDPLLTRWWDPLPTRWWDRLLTWWR